jgi:hypothetical protein
MSGLARIFFQSRLVRIAPWNVVAAVSASCAAGPDRPPPLSNEELMVLRVAAMWSAVPRGRNRVEPVCFMPP